MSQNYGLMHNNTKFTEKSYLLAVLSLKINLELKMLWFTASTYEVNLQFFREIIVIALAEQDKVLLMFTDIQATDSFSHWLGSPHMLAIKSQHGLALDLKFIVLY